MWASRLRAGLGGAALLSAMVVGTKAAAAPATEQGPFSLPPLPYALDALEAKGMSKRTLEFHWGKHHAAYVNNLNAQVKGSKDLEGLNLEQVMLRTWNGGKPLPPFNNAGQVVNHTFFFESMSPHGGGEPVGRLAEALVRDFGSVAAFKQQFAQAGATQFGSGWAWLVVGKDGKLKVTKTPNAENPWCHGETPILTCDVWEHAYYLDYQNRRPDFLNCFLEGLVDWGRVEERYMKATATKSNL